MKSITLLAFLSWLIAVFIPNVSLYASTSSMNQLGASIVPIEPTTFSSAAFKQTLRDLKSDHANSVTFIIPLRQSNEWSADIGYAYNDTTDKSLVIGVNYAHSLGLSVVLKPHITLDNGKWRATIDPGDRKGWFSNYEHYLKHYARIAEANKVEQFIIGTELVYMSSGSHNSDNTQQWKNIISNLRKVYTGKLGYGANWGPKGTWSDEKNQIQFWGNLDFAGVDAYFPLNASGSDVNSFKSAWETIKNSDMTPFANSIGKPVYLTEIGYQSTNGGYRDPGDFTKQNSVNLSEQANEYEALFSSWSSVSYMKGISIWEWKPYAHAGGQNDSDYTPQNKPAEKIMSSWFGKLTK